MISDFSTNDLINIAANLSNMIIPLIVMLLTIRAGNINQKNALRAQKEQYDEQIRLIEEHHQEVLAVQNTLNQLAIIPFLNIHELKGELENRSGFQFYVINIAFINIGLGPATNLKCAYKIKESGFPLVTESNVANYVCIQPFDLKTNTVPIGESCELAMRREVKPDFKSLDFDQVADRVEIQICYNDIMQNMYHQKYDFLMGNMTPNRKLFFSQIHAGEPELLDKSRK